MVELRFEQRKHAHNEILALVTDTVRPMQTELEVLRGDVGKMRTEVAELHGDTYERVLKLAEEMGVVRGTAKEREALQRLIVQEMARPGREQRTGRVVFWLGAALISIQIVETIAILYLAAIGVSHPVIHP